MYELASNALGSDIGALMKDKANYKKVDELLAAGSRIAHDAIEKRLAPLGPLMEKMLQQVMALKPPPPMDPSQAALTVAKVEDARLREETAADGALREKELAEKAAKDRADAINKAEANRVAEEAALKQHAVDSQEAINAAAQIGLDGQQQQFENTQAMLQQQREHAMGADDQQHQQNMDVSRLAMDHQGQQVDQQQNQQQLDQQGQPEDDTGAES